MIRTPHFYRRIGIAALALSGLLGLDAGSTLAQEGVDGLPCSTRANRLVEILRGHPHEESYWAPRLHMGKIQDAVKAVCPFSVATAQPVA